MTVTSGIGFFASDLHTSLKTNPAFKLFEWSFLLLAFLPGFNYEVAIITTKFVKISSHLNQLAIALVGSKAVHGIIFLNRPLAFTKVRVVDVSVHRV